jgi:hypothetical protein
VQAAHELQTQPVGCTQQTFATCTAQNSNAHQGHMTDQHVDHSAKSTTDLHYCWTNTGKTQPSPHSSPETAVQQPTNAAINSCWQNRQEQAANMVSNPLNTSDQLPTSQLQLTAAAQQLTLSAKASDQRKTQVSPADVNSTTPRRQQRTAINNCERQTHHSTAATENSMPTPLTKASPVQQAQQQIIIASRNTDEQHQRDHLQQTDIQLKVKQKRSTATKNLDQPNDSTECDYNIVKMLAKKRGPHFPMCKVRFHPQLKKKSTWIRLQSVPPQVLSQFYLENFRKKQKISSEKRIMNHKI